ncbi:MAG: hypothetical protein QOJ99_5429 [Bryobacterales bacterium]|nr:hypothetical protein [Bryobacterales bacterium]
MILRAGTVQRAQAVAAACPRGHQYWGEFCHVCGPDAPAPVAVAVADPYAAAVTLSNGTEIDYPALTAVMDNVVIGTEVSAAVWRKMREDLSSAITLENKSHPAHGSNFNKKQRPEQQIADWATPIKGPLKEALQKYFLAKYNLYV